MRTTATLLFSVLASCIASAQTPGDTLSMYFDDARDSLRLDSVYPAGCWQVGPPAKPVFTSAYSEPNALVTDTVLPYPDSTTCYAEYSLISIYDGHSRYVSFEHWVDMDSLSTVGWIEVYDEWDTTWRKLEQQVHFWGAYSSVDFATYTDSGVVFTGRSNGWHSVSFLVDCGKIGPVPQHLRVRFVLSSGANLDQRDGWMIDNIRAADPHCGGGIEEQQRIAIGTSPNPASGTCAIEFDGTQGEPYTLELLRAEGSTVLHESRRNNGAQTIDVSGLGDGPYLLRVVSNTKQASTRIIVQH